MANDYSKDIRIGVSAADLIRLTERGIPLPDTWTYMPFAIAYPRSDGIVVGDGFPSASWSWDRSTLSQQQVNTILNLFDTDVQASKTVQIRTPTGTGEVAVEADFDCIMHRPLQGQDKTMVSQSRSPAWSGLTIRFSRLEVA